MWNLFWDNYVGTLCLHSWQFKWKAGVKFYFMLSVYINSYHHKIHKLIKLNIYDSLLICKFSRHSILIQETLLWSQLLGSITWCGQYQVFQSTWALCNCQSVQQFLVGFYFRLVASKEIWSSVTKEVLQQWGDQPNILKLINQWLIIIYLLIILSSRFCFDLV